jgi:hypothetical protein
MKMKTIATIITVFVVGFAGIFTLAFNFGYDNGSRDGWNTGWTHGYGKGQQDTLVDIQAIFKAGAITFNWTQQPDGSYTIQILRFDGNTMMEETASINAATFKVLNTSGLIGDNHKPPVISVNFAWSFQIAEGLGVKEMSGSSGNLITDIGNQYVCNLTVNRAGMTGFTYGNNGTFYIALGNGTSLAYADTKLTQEFASSDTGFKRSAALTPTFATGSGIGNGIYANFTVTNKFTATVADCINATSLQWSGVAQSDLNMFNEATIGVTPATGQAFGVNDNATIAATVTFQK